MTLVVGTAGHIDHGKTTLLRALTGIDADRLPEERRRGMTIDVGYAHLALEDGREIDFVDVPGHDRLVGNMLVGAGEIDAAMLVVAAGDGPRAQTIEHLELLDGLAVPDGLAVVTKIDAVDPARTHEVVNEVAALLARTSLAGSPILTLSALTGDGLDRLRAGLVELRGRVDLDPVGGSGRARLAIDRVFRVKGRGVVVTGSLRGGPISRGATLLLQPAGAEVRVREIQIHGHAVESATRGRTALNLGGIDARHLERGMVLTSDPDVIATDRLLVALRGPGPRDRMRVRLHVGTAEVGAVVGRSGRDAVDLPGRDVAAVLRLEQPVAIAPGDRFVLRRPSPAETLAGGRVLDPDPPRGVSRRRTTAARLTALANADSPAAWTAARLDLHGALPGSPPSVALDVANQLDELLVVVATERGDLSLAELRRLGAGALQRLVRVGLPATDAASAAAIDGLVGAGRLARTGERVRPASRAAPAGPSPEVLDAMDRLEASLDMVSPPALGEAAKFANCPPDGLRELERTNRIVRLADDLAWSFRAYRELAGRALAMATERPLSPAAFRDATGTSRKYVMAILEDLDRRGVLERTADGHIPGPRAPRPATAAPRGERQ